MNTLLCFTGCLHDDFRTDRSVLTLTSFDVGGSTCPEHLEAGAWEISREVEDKWTWVADPDLKVVCVPETNKGHEAGSHEEPHRFPPYVMPHPREKQGDSQEYLEGISELAARKYRPRWPCHNSYSVFGSGHPFDSVLLPVQISSISVLGGSDFLKQGNCILTS